MYFQAKRDFLTGAVVHLCHHAIPALFMPITAQDHTACSGELEKILRATKNTSAILGTDRLLQ